MIFYFSSPLVFFTTARPFFISSGRSCQEPLAILYICCYCLYFEHIFCYLCVSNTSYYNYFFIFIFYYIDMDFYCIIFILLHSFITKPRAVIWYTLHDHTVLVIIYFSLWNCISFLQYIIITHSTYFAQILQFCEPNMLPRHTVLLGKRKVYYIYDNCLLSMQSFHWKLIHYFLLKQK